MDLGNLEIISFNDTTFKLCETFFFYLFQFFQQYKINGKTAGRAKTRKEVCYTEIS